MQSEAVTKAWPFFGYAPGHYGITCARCKETHMDWCCDKRAISCLECSVIAAKAEIERLHKEVERLREALTPSGDTKFAYIGEFSFTIDEQSDDAMCEVSRKVEVPWTTIKEIMAAISKRAALTADNQEQQ